MLLVIGNKRYSTWSLRPWLVLKHFQISFKEELVGLDHPNTASEILKYNPAGKVPVLMDDGNKIWDSLAICEYLNEKYPRHNMWPLDLIDRAHARSISAEMHSGFQNLREYLSADFRKTFPGYDTSKATADIVRVEDVFQECLARSSGPFLFGKFSIADAFYAPVVGRFVTYDVKVRAATAAYMKTILQLPEMQEWLAAAQVEELRVPRYEK